MTPPQPFLLQGPGELEQEVTHVQPENAPVQIPNDDPGSETPSHPLALHAPGGRPHPVDGRVHWSLLALSKVEVIRFPVQISFVNCLRIVAAKVETARERVEIRVNGLIVAKSDFDEIEIIEKCAIIDDTVAFLTRGFVKRS